jgi:hypothetical protein
MTPKDIICKKKNPQVIIERFFLNDGGVTIGCKHWDMGTILASVENLPVYDLQLSAIDLNTEPWSGSNNIDNFLYHTKRTQEADLSYPIIQAPWGYIIDGWHRVCKAILQGETTIKAVRLNVMPQPDRIEKE